MITQEILLKEMHEGNDNWLLKLSKDSQAQFDTVAKGFAREILKNYTKYDAEDPEHLREYLVEDEAEDYMSNITLLNSELIQGVRVEKGMLGEETDEQVKYQFLLLLIFSLTYETLYELLAEY